MKSWHFSKNECPCRAGLSTFALGAQCHLFTHLKWTGVCKPEPLIGKQKLLPALMWSCFLRMLFTFHAAVVIPPLLLYKFTKTLSCFVFSKGDIMWYYWKCLQYLSPMKYHASPMEVPFSVPPRYAVSARQLSTHAAGWVISLPETNSAISLLKIGREKPQKGKETHLPAIYFQCRTVSFQRKITAAFLIVKLVSWNHESPQLKNPPFQRYVYIYIYRPWA